MKKKCTFRFIMMFVWYENIRAWKRLIKKNESVTLDTNGRSLLTTYMYTESRPLFLTDTAPHTYTNSYNHKRHIPTHTDKYRPLDDSRWEVCHPEVTRYKSCTIMTVHVPLLPLTRKFQFFRSAKGNKAWGKKGPGK